MAKTMTKKAAVKEFKEMNPDINEVRKQDAHLASFLWSMFTDALCRQGEISYGQYHRWSNPYSA